MTAELEQTPGPQPSLPVSELSSLPERSPSSAPPSSPAQLHDWLQLLHVTGLSAGLRDPLLQMFGSPGAILAATEGELRALGLEADLAQRICSSSDPDSEASGRTRRALHWQQRQADRYLLLISDAEYPPLLRQIDDPPPLLYVQGNPLALLKPMVAIVGSRNCSQYGLAMASQLAADLSAMGLVVCSGLAHGIDASAHRAAVRVGRATVAVLGNGLHSIYPAAHRTLADQITNGPSERAGALVSELPLDAGPLASHFPRRNRIISGMSLGVCVVEAVLRSGSLITARLALEQNRNVFAVPGSINNTRSRGCHHLIREGAVLVESAADIASHLESLLNGQLAMLQQKVQPGTQQPELPGLPTSIGKPLPSLSGKLLNLLSDDPVGLDVLQARTGSDIADLNEALLGLELAGRAIGQGGRWFKTP